MPYTKKQVRVAQAIKHGWKPSDKSLEGFTKKFAKHVIAKGVKK